MPDFLETGPSIAEILRYFDFSNDRCRHLGFLNLWNFIGRQCRRAQTHHHAKCRKNWSFCCGDIAVFRIFKMATTGILDFLNHEILLAIGVQRSRRICMPNFVKIGQSVAKILRFLLIFQAGGCRHLGLSNSQTFIGWRCLKGPDASLNQISSKSVYWLEDNKIFRFFSSGFVWGTSGPPTVSIWGSLSLCKIWLWSMQ